MTAVEVINEIKALAPEEQEKVIRFVAEISEKKQPQGSVPFFFA